AGVAADQPSRRGAEHVFEQIVARRQLTLAPRGNQEIAALRVERFVLLARLAMFGRAVRVEVCFGRCVLLHVMSAQSAPVVCGMRMKVSAPASFHRPAHARAAAMPVSLSSLSAKIVSASMPAS